MPAQWPLSRAPLSPESWRQTRILVGHYLRMRTFQIAEKFNGGGMKVRATDGIAFSFTLSTSRESAGALRVSWASDWDALHELHAAGLLRRTFDRHCFGHTEFFATPQLLERVAA